MSVLLESCIHLLLFFWCPVFLFFWSPVSMYSCSSGVLYSYSSRVRYLCTPVLLVSCIPILLKSCIHVFLPFCFTFLYFTLFCVVYSLVLNTFLYVFLFFLFVSPLIPCCKFLHILTYCHYLTKPRGKQVFTALPTSTSLS